MQICRKQAKMIEVAKEMAPVLLGRARNADKDRAVTQQTIDELTDQGFFRIHQPERYGGMAWDISMMVRISAELGQGCGLSCQIFSDLTVQNWILGMNNPAAQDDVWGDNPMALIASSAPVKDGYVKRTDGGLIMDGQWSSASGIDFADWNNMQVFVPPEDGEGLPEHRFALVPKSDYDIEDDSYSLGLAGTGSRTIQLNNVFIPEHRTISSTKLMGGTSPGSEINPGALYRVPSPTLETKVFSAPALGIAKGGLAMIENDISGRKTVGNAAMAELSTAQTRVSEAGAEIDAAEALLLKDCDDAMSIAKAGDIPGIDDRARWSRNNAFAVQLCVRALERLNPLVGARGLTPENDFLRMLRDVHTASLQIMVDWDTQAENSGRIRFGLMPLYPRV